MQNYTSAKAAAMPEIPNNAVCNIYIEDTAALLLVGLEVLPVPVPVAVIGAILAPPVSDGEAWMGFATTEALGTALLPVPISRTWLVVALKLV